MNTIKSGIGAGLFAVAALTASLAMAESADASRKVTVYYDELNMSSSRGATALYARLRSASRQVCAPFEGRDLRQRAAFDACYQQALSNAVAQVNRAPVTALHARIAKGVKTS